MIDRRLFVLQLIHQYGSIAAAAKALHVTPPALSQQVRQLSKELGTPLLEQHGRGVQLTSAGQVVVDHTNVLRAQWERALGELAAHEGSDTGPLRLCGFPSAIARLLAPAAASLRETNPGIRVHITEAESAEVFQALLAETVDIALHAVTLDTPPATDPRFDQLPLLEDPHDLVVPATHEFADRASIELGDAASESWIVADPGPSQTDQLIRSACTMAGFTPAIAHCAAEWNAVAALVAQGLGVSLIPRMVPLASAPVVRIPLRGDPPPGRRLLTCVRKGSHEHPVVKAGLAALRRIARSIQDPAVADAAH